MVWINKRPIAEKRICDILSDVEMSNEIDNQRYAVNGPHLLPGTPNNAAQNIQNQHFMAFSSGSPTGPFLSKLEN